MFLQQNVVKYLSDKFSPPLQPALFAILCILYCVHCAECAVTFSDIGQFLTWQDQPQVLPSYCHFFPPSASFQKSSHCLLIKHNVCHASSMLAYESICDCTLKIFREAISVYSKQPQLLIRKYYIIVSET